MIDKNYEEIACDFVDWLVQNGYYTVEEGIQDTQEMIEDFMIMEEYCPRMFNLLACISDR